MTYIYLFVLINNIPGWYRKDVPEITWKSISPPFKIEVLELVGMGLTNTEIAQRLFLGESTVRTYLRRLLTKLHLRNRAEATAYAVRRLPLHSPPM